MKTKLTELLGIKYPIIQTGMQWLAVPKLAAAVSNAGGIGTINVTCWQRGHLKSRSEGTDILEKPCWGSSLPMRAFTF